MKLTFIFTDTPDLKTLSKYDIYRTHFEFPDEILELLDCEDRLLTIAQQVGQLTYACLHVSCKEIAWQNYFIKNREEAPEYKRFIKRDFYQTVIGFDSPYYRRQRQIKVHAPKGITFAHLLRNLTKRQRKRSVSKNLLPFNIHAFQTQCEATHPYIQTLSNIADVCIELLNLSQHNWRITGIHPYWWESRLIDEYNRRKKAREKEQRKQQREAQKRAAKVKKQKSKVGQVYFIQQGETGPIKIGYSTNPQKRLQSLNTANPYPLRLLTTIIGDEALEQALHEQFAAHRLDGEWFEPAPDLLAYIALHS